MQTSAAMLGLALSFGASAPLLTEPELALAADGPNLTVLPAAHREQGQTPKLIPAQAITSSAYHTVEPGESLWKIAAQHEADVQTIKAANGIVADDMLRVGQVIRVPAVGMDNLTTAADASRFALKADVSGGVGGDLTAASGLLPTSDIPSVDEFQKTWELDETLSLDEEDELSEELLADSDLNQLPIEDIGAETELEPIETVSVLSSNETTASEATVSSANEAWVVADAQGALADSQQATERGVVVPTVQPIVEAAPVDAWQASLPLHDGNEASVANQTPTPVTASAQVVESKKDLAMAALPLRSSSMSSTSAVTDSGALHSYQVKPGDTLWSIASRNGVTLDELLSHNHTVQSPEALLVGDSISIPVASVPAEVAEADELVSSAVSELAAAPRTREQVIRDHLARIRESNSALVDRNELNARIREARQELERSRTGADSPAAVSLEYHTSQPAALAAPAATGGVESASATALAVREGAQTTDTQWTVTDVAKDQPQAVAALGPSLDPTVETPEQPAQAAPVQLESDAIPSQLLAAAPLGADAYRVAPNMPVGQTVTPNMPMMPGADQFLPEAPSLSNGFVWPTQGTFTSGYGWRWGRMHRGIDIAGPVGTPIVAAATGVVVRSGWNSGGYGNLVDIRHADGSMTRYAHNSRLLVREGQQVRQGQQISEMGSTGYSTGPHLHFEIHPPNSGAVNPMAYLPDR
ncbi:peptidoglycan DD-metalloendopeptidase family protein [Nodosilinea sp. LEGE 07298]|uniref:peptidoglycan DD-metalloendopeptidase family protein n=1 Tax=Nodosilinea sp. LEGE 07298 TaxID=2777970 RepID=UPI001881D401|nr:peptidoglycan DD-metalloendopeptidase family protein [Nodosilinea sp. LEGE 07298]